MNDMEGGGAKVSLSRRSTCSSRGAPVRLCSAAPSVDNMIPTRTMIGCGHEIFADRMYVSTASVSRSATAP